MEKQGEPGMSSRDLCRDGQDKGVSGVRGGQGGQ